MYLKVINIRVGLLLDSVYSIRRIILHRNESVEADGFKCEQ
jgi:hypothetical protein